MATPIDHVRTMEHHDVLATLQRIESLARELGHELPQGLARHRAQHIAAIAASAALDVRLTRRAANDAGAERASSGAD